MLAREWSRCISSIRFGVYSGQLITFNRQSDMEAAPIETLIRDLCKNLDTWFNAETCEALAKSTGFIQRRTSRLTGSDFFKSADG